MDFGQASTIWTARAAAALYACGVVLMLRGRWPAARYAQTAGVLVYLLHVWCAFEFFYGWSHAAAYRETERQTAELFGIAWGGGLFLNYAFTAVWVADCVMSWWRTRPLWLTMSVHGFLLFMFVNATVVVWVLRD